MKVHVKTAHGYLSFQPPVPGDAAMTVPPLQYRPTAGVWEEIDLEGLELPTVPPPPETGTGPTPPAFELPGGIPPSETAGYVDAIKNWLLSQGKNLSGPCGAFEIVANVAWGVQTLNTGAGILSKPDGNNCMSYSVDIIAYKDYANGGTRIVDILGDGGGANTPMWGEKGSEENVAMDRWRPPINPATVTNAQYAATRKR